MSGQITYLTIDGTPFVVDAIEGASVMQIATSNGVPGIDAECGGSLTCATCHVYVDEEWFENVGAPSRSETEMLTFAEEPGATSRLSCQIRYQREFDGLIVRIPEQQ
jgi:2Fe-2S ferredoxin